ncbi:uncharacterized protein [Nicotiana sylvestris]|uniref:uncharacterized protein n=1 Tax=Nicotiana sylvestris TaxID=4096 RepID=UPI00388CC9A8
MKDQTLADHLVENPVDEEYEPLRTYFPDEKVMHIDEVEQDENPGWKLFFDGTANMKGVRIGAVLISETGHHYPVTAQLRFYCTKNMAEYEACILGLRLAVDMGVQEVLVLEDSDLLVHQIQGEWETWDLKLIPYQQCLHDLCQRFRSVEFRHIPRIHNAFVDALATLTLMLHHPDKAYIDPLHIQVCDKHAYCNVVEEELDGEPWFHDIREYIKMGVYPVQATAEIDDDEWVKTRLEQLSLIDEKRLAVVCHGQLYQKRMARAYNKKVHPRKFEVGQQVLKRIIPHQVEAKGKFVPNLQGPFIVTRELSNGALYLTDIEGEV